MNDRDLPVRLFDTHVGDLTAANGKALLRWSSAAEERWGLNSPVLSRNLRVGAATVEQSESFFGALLPEGLLIDRLATSAKTVSNDLMGLLRYVGADLRSCVESEHYVRKIAHELGLAPFETWVERVGDLEVLVIERYDRRRTERGAIERLHQKDAGQALGISWGANDKFEANNPTSSLRSVAGLLDSARAVLDPARFEDRRKLLGYTVLNVASGNTDAHAKNFSLLHDDRGRTRLAPFYDAAPLALDPLLGSALAMEVNGISQLPDVSVDDLIAEAEAWGIPAAAAAETIAGTLDAIIEATRAISAHPSIEKRVPGYIRGQAQNLAAGRNARLDSAKPLLALPRLD